MTKPGATWELATPRSLAEQQFLAYAQPPDLFPIHIRNYNDTDNCYQLDSYGSRSLGECAQERRFICQDLQTTFGRSERERERTTYCAERMLVVHGMDENMAPFLYALRSKFINERPKKISRDLSFLPRSL